MTPWSILLAVLFAGFAVSYGWGIRGFVIGGEKGALLPGALMGIAVAFFSMGEQGKDFWMYFAAAGALTMFYGGTETYAQTMSFLLSRDKEGPYYNRLKTGVVGIFLKGGLWFSIPGFVLSLLPSALTGAYKIWEVCLLFTAFPVVSFIGTKIFNTPYDKAKGIHPKIYFSLDRREEWGSNVMIILVLTVFSLVKGDFYALGAGLWGFITGGLGFLIGLVLYDIERRHGEKIFGKRLHKKGYIDGWKIMEHAFGAFAGGGLMLYFALVSPHFIRILRDVSLTSLPLVNDKYLCAAVCLVLMCFTALQYPLTEYLEKKGKRIDIGTIEQLERPLWSAVPLIFIFLGSPSAAAFGTFGTLAFALCEKCSVEWYERSEYKKILRFPFKLMWLVLPMWFFFNIMKISLFDTMLLYTLGYTGACALYSFGPDRIKAYVKKEADFSRAFGSGLTATGHLILQSAILIYLSLIID